MAKLNDSSEWQPDVKGGIARLRELQRTRRHARRILPLVAAAVICVTVVLSPRPRVFAHYCLDCTMELWHNISRQGMPNLKIEETRIPAPDFMLNNAIGQPVQLSSMKGKVVLLNFWATWCHGCATEIPWFIEFEKEFKGSGLEVIGVSMDDSGWKAVTPFAQEKKINYILVLGNDELGRLYGLTSMPMTVLIDRNGRVAASYIGVVIQAECRKEIEALLKERD